MSESDKASIEAVATEAATAAPDVWTDRKKNNIRLGWICGVIALAVFFLAIWRLRIP